MKVLWHTRTIQPFINLGCDQMDHLCDDDDVFNAEEEEYEPSDTMSQSVPSVSQDDLERCGRWLLSVPRQDSTALQQTQEYADFIAAFERLASIHRSEVARSRSFMALEDRVATTREPLPYDVHRNKDFSFLQHMADDDTVIRAFEFLECKSLVRISMTCSRFRELAYRSAAQRTYDVAQARQLNSVMKLLRAKEQIDGIGTRMADPHVRVPVLLLGRRVLITNAGDTDYNGVYFCTGTNGNGFIFTKPRFPEGRILWSDGTVRMRENIANADERGRLGSEVAHPGQLLRCIIAKRFSNEVSDCASIRGLGCRPLEVQLCRRPHEFLTSAGLLTLLHDRLSCGTLAKKCFPWRMRKEYGLVL
jgi:hypothetical protein